MLARLLQTLRLAARNLHKQRSRSFVALMTVVGGVLAYLLAGGFIEWIFKDMRESTIHSQLGHIQIIRPGYFNEGIADPYRHLLPEGTEEVLSSISKHVVTASPRLAFGGLASKGEATVSFIGEGIDPAREAPITRAITITEGKDLAEGTADSALLGEGLAANLGASPGDSIVLLSNTASGGVNAVELRVVGLFATKIKTYDDTTLRAPIGVARKLMRVSGATSLVVLLKETDSTTTMVNALRKALPADQYEVVPWSDLADFYNKTVELFSRQVGVVRFLIGIIVVLSISNTLSMSVTERTGEIGTLMALGVRRHSILALFIIEGLLLGIIGAAVGVGLGFLLGRIISWIGIPMPPPPGMARGYIGQIEITAALAFNAFLLASITTVIASVIPALRASRMEIVDALRHQR